MSEAYVRYVREIDPHPTDAGFIARGYTGGCLEDVSELREALRTAKPMLLSQDDHLKRYAFNPNLDKVAEAMNATHTYFSLNAHHHAALRPLLSELYDKVAGCVGANWKVVNVRAWGTPLNSKTGVGSDKWHADGFPPPVLKLMIYVSGAGPRIGTTEIRLADESTVAAIGAPGTWLIFKNSELMHRGVPPTEGERLVVEVTLIPSKVKRLALITAGLNAQYPLDPSEEF